MQGRERATTHELPQTNAKAAPKPALRGDIPLRDRVQGILDLIRPAVQSDGGDIELLDITAEGVVKVRMHGACVGCPSSSMTLRQGIERNLREHVPEVTGVQAVD